jgi:hypothetical protein
MYTRLFYEIVKYTHAHACTYKYIYTLAHAHTLIDEHSMALKYNIRYHSWYHHLK